MLKKLSIGFLVAAALIGGAILTSTNHAQASGEKFFFSGFLAAGSDTYVTFNYTDSAGQNPNSGMEIVDLSGVTSDADLKTATNAAIVSWANGSGGFSGVTASQIYSY